MATLRLLQIGSSLLSRVHIEMQSGSEDGLTFSFVMKVEDRMMELIRIPYVHGILGRIEMRGEWVEN